jgi:TP901 family phage tail tape measure protein
VPNVQIVLEVDDRGTAKIRRFTKTLENDSRKAARRAGESFETLGTKTAASIDKMTTRFLKWGSVVGGVFGGLLVRSIVKFGAEFERRMSGVRAVTQASATDMGQLERQARQLGATTVFTANQAAEAMEELGKAGFETTEVLGVMPDVLNLAAAGELEMAEAASIASDLIRSLGLEISEFGRATDVVAKTATSSKTTVAELGFAFQDSAPVARSLGVNVEELNALLGVLANRGFTATRAGTALRRIMAVFLGDVEEGEKGLSGFNLKIRDSEGNFVGFAEALREFERAGIGANEIMEAFGLRGGPAFLQIWTAGEKTIEEWIQRLREAGGEAERVAEERMNNLSGRTRELISAFQEMGLVIFDKVGPALTEMAVKATETLRSWGEALAITDVAAGLEKTILALKSALFGLGVVLGIGLLRKAQAAAAALVGLAFAHDTVALSVVRSTSAMTAFNLATVGQRVAIFGLVAAAGAAGYAFGRWLGQVTGLDGAMQRLLENSAIARLFGGDFAPEIDAGRFAVSVDRFERELGKVELAGKNLVKNFQLTLSGDELKLVERARTLKRELATIDDEAEKLTRLELSAALVEDLLELSKGLDGITVRLNKVREEAPEAFDAAKRATSDWKDAVDATKNAEDEAEKQRRAAAQAAQEAAEKAAEAMKTLEEQFQATGFATVRMANAVRDDVNKALEAAGAEGIATEVVFRAFGDTILGVETGLRNAGQAGTDLTSEFENMAERVRTLRAEYAALRDAGFFDPVDGGFADPSPVVPFDAEDIPFEELEKLGEAPDPTAWEQFFDTLRDNSEAFVDNIGERWAQFAQSGLNVLGRLSQAILNSNQSISEAFRNAWRSILAEGLNLLVQWGVQRLIFSQLSKKATVSEATAEFGKAIGLTFANTMASMSAAPFPINLTAPAVAAAHSTIAAGGITAGIGQGIGLGAGLAGGAGAGVAGAQEGAIVTRDTILRAGEFGNQEAIVPLQGPAARRVGRLLADAIGETGGGSVALGPITVNAGAGADGAAIVDEILDELNFRIGSGRTLALADGIA